MSVIRPHLWFGAPAGRGTHAKIGDELAVSRALADLSHQLLEVAAADIEQTTQDRVRLRG
ncbi:DUF1876 domain-containing protein [Micromonospora sp. CPCC 205371]|nr:DUF1876 domain-containing protein [Micromonospora sp. CPCC 205371]